MEQKKELTPAQRLSAAFEVWKTKWEDSAGLNRAIEVAMANRIGLILRVSDKVLDENVGRQRLSRGNVGYLATGREGGLIMFDIPSDKKFELVAVDDWDHKGPPSLLIKSGDGIFGTFSPDQVAALEIK
jgi:hypothetical protein